MSSPLTKKAVMKEVVSLATLFRKNGYNTYAFGKRHTHDAIDEGWDVKRSHLCGESEEGYVSWLEEAGYMDEFSTQVWRSGRVTIYSMACT